MTMMGLPSVVVTTKCSSTLEVCWRYCHSYVILVIRFVVESFIISRWRIDIAMLRYVLVAFLKLIPCIALPVANIFS